MDNRSFAVTAQADGYIGPFTMHTKHVFIRSEHAFQSNQLLVGASFLQQRLEVAVGPVWARNPIARVSHMSKWPSVAAEYTMPLSENTHHQTWMTTFARTGGGYAPSTGFAHRATQWSLGLSMQYRSSPYLMRSSQHHALKPLYTVFHQVPVIEVYEFMSFLDEVACSEICPTSDGSAESL